MNSTATACPQPALPLIQKLGWFFSLLVPALILLTVGGEGLTREMVIFIAITAWAIVCWATEILPAPMVGILLPIFYFAAKLAPAPIALAKPFATVIPWSVIGALLIGLLAQKTGLAKRIVLKCMVMTGSSYPGLFFAMFVSGLILTPLVPSATAKSAIMLALGVGACDALKLEKGSREASAVLFASFLAVCGPRFGILTATLENLTVTRLMASVTHVPVGYTDFAIQNFIPSMLYCALSMGLVLFMVRGKGKLNKSALLAQYHEMGPISRNEMLAAFFAVFAVVIAATQKYHGLPGMHLFVAIAALAFVPKIQILNHKEFGEIAFPMIFFIAGSLAIGFVAGHVGMGKWLSSQMLPLAQSMDSVFGLSTLAYTFGAIMNFFLTPLAAQALMTVPLAELAQSMNMQPYPVVYSFLYGTDQYLFAYEFAMLLLFCSTGHLRLPHVAKLLGIRMLLTPIFIGLVAVPYWSFLGLI
ncbi:SLC13 family permease [Desulfobaculum bizertense]|uniref:Di-and tricarboxylate transporter n=1 Tax=Desulfobaculum bizertense DSM 18034 TaxID=1121442 RepID=A0A1T4X483_9BACT|nr:SLC13 family permease [Desulfobaculum bizertense]SKA84412.1 Di-and tricarboxylate transporter [Desulfobaculum bizertense DSM 18034]